MSGFDQLDKEFAEALTRLHASSPAPVPSRESAVQRYAKRGAAGLAALVLVGGVGTAAASVAGLEPWAFLTASDTVDPRRSPVAQETGAVVLGSAADQSPAWKIRAYQTVEFGVCITGGAQGSTGAGRTCDSSATVINELVGENRPGVYAFAHPTSDDRSVLVYGLAAPDVEEISIAGADLPSIAPGSDAVRVTRDPQRTGGLTTKQTVRLSSLPTSVDARPFAAVVQLPELKPGQVPSLVFKERAEGAVTLQLQTADRPGPDPEDLQGDTPPVRSISSEQASALPALTRPRDSADALEVKLDSALRAQGAQPELSRRLTISGNEPALRVWAMPGETRVCLQSSDPNLSVCVPNAFVKRYALTGVVCSETLDRQKRLVWGIVPPGTDSVRVTYDGGSVQNLATADLLAIWLPRSGPQLRTIEWHQGERWIPNDSPLPANSSEDQCGK